MVIYFPRDWSSDTDNANQSIAIENGTANTKPMANWRSMVAMFLSNECFRFSE